MCERSIDQLPLAHPQQGIWPATWACALTGNQNGNPLVHRPALSPLSHTSQGDRALIFNHTITCHPFYSAVKPWLVMFRCREG